MRNGQFTNEQFPALLQEAEKRVQSISVFCREKGITETTNYRWRHRFGGLGVKDVQTPANPELRRLPAHARAAQSRSGPPAETLPPAGPLRG
jgi:hypothetical protein